MGSKLIKKDKEWFDYLAEVLEYMIGKSHDIKKRHPHVNQQLILEYLMRMVLTTLNVEIDMALKDEKK